MLDAAIGGSHQDQQGEIMFETYTAIVGTVVSEPRHRTTKTGDEVVSFRVACNSRRRDRESGEWNDGPVLYLTISCWKRLLAGVALAIRKGRPIIAHGQIRTREYFDAEGHKRADLEMTAGAIGLDLARCLVTYRGTPAEVAAGDPEVVPESAPTRVQRVPAREPSAVPAAA